IGCTTATMVRLTPVKFQQLQLTPAQFAQWWAYLHLALAGFGLLVWAYEALLGRRRALVSLVAVSLIGYLGLILAPGRTGLYFLALFMLVRAVQMPSVSHNLALLVQDRGLNTVLSVMSTIQFALYVALNITLGYLVDT